MPLLKASGAGGARAAGGAARLSTATPHCMLGGGGYGSGDDGGNNNNNSGTILEDDNGGRVVAAAADVDWASVDFLPSRRYVRGLALRYASELEGRGVLVEDDGLASLLCHLSMMSGGGCGGGGNSNNLPDPTSPCIVTFRVPRRSMDNDDDDVEDDVPQSQSPYQSTVPPPTEILRIRTYPHHNDVGVAKVWEAGACLAEYLVRYPERVRGRDVVELGAGVGLTALVAAGVAGANSVHATDYTEACLDNLAHNVTTMIENGTWLPGVGGGGGHLGPEALTVVRKRRSAIDSRDPLCPHDFFVCRKSISIIYEPKGKLEWGDYSKRSHADEEIMMMYADGPHHAHAEQPPPWADSIVALSRADVLLAADVVYDVDCIPDLVATVCKFLRGKSVRRIGTRDEDDDGVGGGTEECGRRRRREAIFATTFRNEKTFGLFERELEERGVVCAYHRHDVRLPDIFPCYFNQPRSDVRVCTMHMKP